MDVDKVLLLAGGFGRFQVALGIICVLAPATDPWTGLDVYFSAKVPNWICTANNSECNTTKIHTANDRSRCEMPGSSWQYVESKKYSMVTDFGIDCDDEWKLQVASMAYFIGSIVSAVLLGWISDNFGRKKLLAPGMFLHLLTATLRGFAPDIWTVTILRFLSGMACVTGYAQMQVLGAEFVPESYRNIIGPFMNCTYPAGRMLLSLVAYLTQEWRMTIFAGQAPFFIIDLFLLLVPESVQWLRSKGKTAEALKVLQKIAKVNGRTLPSNIKIEADDNKRSKCSSSPLDLFANWHVAGKTIILSYVFFASSAVYYGLALAADDISSGSMYLSFFLVSLIEIPATIIAMYFLKRIGRKAVCCLSMVLMSIFLVLVILVPNSKKFQAVRLAIGVIGSMFAAVQFMSIYVWTIDLYPILLRNQAVCLGFCMSKIGSSVCRWIAKGALTLHPLAPLVIMAVMAFLGSLLGLTLPSRHADYSRARSERVPLVTLVTKEQEATDKMSINHEDSSEIKQLVDEV